MKKIRKIAASLMALAITAAGMSSISASAYCYAYATLYCGTHTAQASVCYIPRQCYTGNVSAQGDSCICYKSVNVASYRSNGTRAGYDEDSTYEWYYDVSATVNASCSYSRIMASAKARYKNGNNPYYETPLRTHQFNL